jgi:hypothetical protein
MAHKKVSSQTRLNRDPVGHLGRSINTLKNISGLNAGGSNVTVLVPTGDRKHAHKLFCTAVYYTGGTGLTATKISSTSGAGLTVTPTLVNYEPTTVAIVNGGTGWQVNDTFTFTDATGQGAVFTVASVNSGAVLTATYVAGSAVATPIPPHLFFQSLQVQIASATPYNVDPIFYTMRAQAQGRFPALGELQIAYSQPERQWLQNNDITSWDTYGASSMQIVGTVFKGLVKPGLTGDEDHDARRNSFVDSQGNTHVFNNPLKFFQAPIQLVVGQTQITNLPIQANWKLLRLWVLCQTTPGSINYIEFWANGQQRLEGNVVDIRKEYAAYGFRFGQPDYMVSSIAGSNLLQASYNPLRFSDAEYIADIDGRIEDAVDVSGGHILKLTSTVAQNATVYMEACPGGFA